MVILDLQVTFVDAIDLNEFLLIHKLIDDEIVLIHIYKCKMASKNGNRFQNDECFFFLKIFMLTA